MKELEQIRPLNSHERESIRVALADYIERHPAKCWSQKIILNEMLDYLLWMKLSEATA